MVRVDARDDLLVGVEARDPSVREDERVHCVAVGLVAELRRGPLVGDRHVRARKARGDEPAHHGLELVRRDVERDVRPVEPARRERGVLHPRRQRVGNRVPEERHEARRPGKHQ